MDGTESETPHGRDQRSGSHDGRYDERHEEQEWASEEAPQPSGVPRRRGVSVRPPRPDDVPVDAAPDAADSDDNPPSHLSGGGPLVDATVFAQLTSQLEQHLHVPLQMPDQDRLERMKVETPEAYQVWLRVVDRQSKTDANLRELPYRMPYKVARLGQFCGLSAVLALFGLAAYIAYLGAPGWAFGTGLSGVIGLAAVFNGGRAQGSGS